MPEFALLGCRGVVAADGVDRGAGRARLSGFARQPWRPSRKYWLAAMLLIGALAIGASAWQQNASRAALAGETARLDEVWSRLDEVGRLLPAGPSTTPAQTFDTGCRGAGRTERQGQRAGKPAPCLAGKNPDPDDRPGHRGKGGRIPAPVRRTSGGGVVRAGRCRGLCLRQPDRQFAARFGLGGARAGDDDDLRRGGGDGRHALRPRRRGRRPRRPGSCSMPSPASTSPTRAASPRARPSPTPPPSNSSSATSLKPHRTEKPSQSGGGGVTGPTRPARPVRPAAARHNKLPTTIRR